MPSLVLALVLCFTRAAFATLPGGQPVVVKLQRTAAPGGSHFYVGRISVGLPPQDFQVLFDTASGHVLLPHKACRSPGCEAHRQFSPSASQSAVDINLNGKRVQPLRRIAKGSAMRDVVNVSFTQADLGEGTARAVAVQDQVCLGGSVLGGLACTDMSVLAAIGMDEAPFRAMPHDGIVGLGLAGLAACPSCSLLASLAAGSEGLLPQFGVAFGAAAGELFIGGHDSARLAAPLQWFPVVHPDDGLWEVAVRAVRVGNVTVDSCSGGCRGVIDTGASQLGVQKANFQALHSALALASAPGPTGGCQGPALEFDLGGFALVLRVEDYAGAACSPQLGSLDLEAPEFRGVYALGETVLRRYYAAFDWDAKRIGFAPAAKRLVRVGRGAAPVQQASPVATESPEMAVLV